MIIKISKIILDAKAQPRTELNSEIIQEYAQTWKDGSTRFPPIVVYCNEVNFELADNYWLADGWHRVNAAKVAGVKEIEADVRTGTLRDAILFSVSANAKHGMRRTNADKRRAVMTILEDSDWSLSSDNAISKLCGVSQNFVSELRNSYLTSDVRYEPTERIVERNGTTYTMKLGDLSRRNDDDLLQARQVEPATVEQVESPTSVFGLSNNSHEEMEPVHKTSRPVFNKTNENIEWAHWSWNPVTGCEHDCDYCYARDIANRFYPEKFTPTFHPERLDAPKNTNPDMTGGQGGKSVFVCSMADLFGSWVPNEWIWDVLEQVKQNPQWTFIFLTKNPRRLASIVFPDNAWVGCTVDRQARVKPAEEAMRNVNASVRFISCEPMLEQLKFDDLSMIDWLIIGARSKTTQCPEFQPDFLWVHNLTDQAISTGVKVYWKPNLTCRPQEYPDKKE